MENLALKTKISVLWLFEEVAFLAYMMLTTLEPGVIEQIMAGEIEGMKIGPEILLLLAILLLVPLVMAFLSLTLKDSTNRWANIILGIVFAGLELLNLVELLANPSAHRILMTLSKVVVAALIVWYAYKWPKEGV
jgi:hypothetical protein